MTNEERINIEKLVLALKGHDRPLSSRYELKKIKNKNAVSIQLNVDDSGEPLQFETVTAETAIDIFESYLKNNQ